MTERERQIVYPLLVFALLMGLKGNFQPRLSFEARSIECAELKVSMINGKAVTDSRFPVRVPPLVRRAEAAGEEAAEAPTKDSDAVDLKSTDSTQAAEPADDTEGSKEGREEASESPANESESPANESESAESPEVIKP